ncbi:MAG: patatin-like phospholipase family protein, partial [Desulfosarcina sp.]
MTSQFRNLVFEGGGVKGIAYVGAMQVLAQRGLLEDILRVGGTSVGAIQALMVALGRRSRLIRTVAERQRPFSRVSRSRRSIQRSALTKKKCDEKERCLTFSDAINYNFGEKMNRKNVAIVLFNDIEVLDFCGPFEVFSAARLNEERRREEPSPFEVSLTAETLCHVTTTGGMKVM